MRVIAIIPARSGSKGVPNKNIRMLGGYPLIAWSISAAKKTRLINEVVVSTDSEEYAQIANNYGASVPFLRPVSLSKDDSSDLSCIQHALGEIRNINGRPDIIVHLRPTTPLRDPKLIDSAIEDFLLDRTYTAMRSVHEMPESAYKSMEIANSGILKGLNTPDTSLDRLNDSRQSYPKTYSANGYVDVLDVGFIKTSGFLHGDRVKAFVTPKSFEIDTFEDFAHIEYLVETDSSHSSKLFD